MKKLLFFLFIGLVCSGILNAEENETEQILVLTDGRYLLPGVEYQITFSDGKRIEGKSKSQGTITVKTTNTGNYRLELDLEPLFYLEEDPPELEMSEQEMDAFEFFFLKHPEDEETIETFNGRKISRIKHNNDCNYLRYDVTLENGKNYLLIYTSPPMSGISD